MYYMGIDHHMQSSHMTIIDERGREVKSGRVLNRRKEIETFLEGIAITELEAVIESGRASYTMIAHLESIGVKVKMAHALQLKAIAQAKIKTDKRDARMLAHLLRSDLIPEVYLRDADNRRAQRVLRHRVFHVRMQSRVKNRIRALLAKHTEEEVQDLSHWESLFTKKGLELLKEIDLPGEDGRMLASLIRIIEQLAVEIRTSDAMISQLYKNSSQARLISTVPGFGRFFSLLVATEIADIKRFTSHAKLHSYAGVIPSTYASGNRSYHGRLVRQGNKWLRWAVVEAVWPARKVDHGLNVLYLSLVRRKGANSAKIVIARRLLTIIYRVLKEERVYEPFKRD